jgi:hypothetical protein
MHSWAEPQLCCLLIRFAPVPWDFAAASAYMTRPQPVHVLRPEAVARRRISSTFAALTVQSPNGHWNAVWFARAVFRLFVAVEKT